MFCKKLVSNFFSFVFCFFSINTGEFGVQLSEVLCIGTDCDLALLEVPFEDFWKASLKKVSLFQSVWEWFLFGDMEDINYESSFPSYQSEPEKPQPKPGSPLWQILKLKTSQSFLNEVLSKNCRFMTIVQTTYLLHSLRKTNGMREFCSLKFA